MYLHFSDSTRIQKFINCIDVVVAHKLPNGVMTPFFKELGKGNILSLPRTVDELQKFTELVLYNHSPYTFHHRFKEALVKFQEPNYVYMEESEMKYGNLMLMMCITSVQLNFVVRIIPH